MVADRVRLGVSVSVDTRDLCDELVEEGVASNRSHALDVLALAWRDRQANSDLLRAAAAMTGSAEATVPGVVGGTRANDEVDDGSDDDGAMWSVLQE